MGDGRSTGGEEYSCNSGRLGRCPAELQIRHTQEKTARGHFTSTVKLRQESVQGMERFRSQQEAAASVQLQRSQSPIES